MCRIVQKERCPFPFPIAQNIYEESLNGPARITRSNMLRKYTLNLIQVGKTVILPQACGAGEPAECEHRHTNHGEQEAEGLLFHQAHGAAAGGADVVGHGCVWSRLVHAELESLPGAEVAGLCGGGDVLLRVVDNEGVGFGEERDGAGGLVFARVPDDGLRLLPGLVGCNGVDGVVGRAGGQDFDVLGVAGQGCVVPGEGDLVVDLVVAGGRHGVRGDHGRTACRHARVEDAGGRRL